MIVRASLVLCLLVVACGGRPTVITRPTIEALRTRAQGAPNDADLQATLAIAEAFANDGDPARAPDQAQKALQLAPQRSDVALTAGLIAEVTGDPDLAFDHYARALLAAKDDSDPTSLRVAEVAVMGVTGLFDAFADYNAKTRALLEPLVLDAQTLHAPARHAALSLLLSLAERRGEMAEQRRLVALDGCVTAMRVAGPFGPHDLIGFDQAFAPERDATLADRYDLGPRRGERATRPVRADGCSLNLGAGPVADSGVTYGEGTVHAEADGAYLLRLSAPNSTEVFVDGRSVTRIDRRSEIVAGTLYVPLTLSAGAHRVLIKVASRHPNPAVALGLSAMGERDAAAIDVTDRVAARSDFDSELQAYLQATLAFQREDSLGAREALRHVDGRHNESPLLLLQAAHAWMRDPLTPSDVRMDRGRALLEASLRRLPTLWSPTLRLATLEADNGRVNEAIATLRTARQRWPKIPSLALSLIELLNEREWYAEADQVLADVRARFPTLCGGAEAAMDAARRKVRTADTLALTEEIMQCNARSNARYTSLLRQRKNAEARAELQRLIALDDTAADSLGILRTQLDLALELGERDQVREALAALQQRYPRAPSLVVDRLDHTLAAGDRTGALALLDAAFRDENAAMSSLRRVEGVLRGQHIMDVHRVDGLRAIADFEASGRSYDGPQVLVWDYMVIRVFPDGSALKLVHSIHRVQSDEAADDLGEIEVPEDARVLTLRTVKADKHVLEPDAISGKDTISLPNVAPGDYTEVEYLIADDPSSAFATGYMGDRFYFRSFEVPFDTSFLTVVLPKDMAVTVDRRGDAPPLHETVQDDQRVMSWKVVESRPLTREAGSVAHREYIPSVRVVARATWPELVASIRDALVDKDLADPELRELVESIVGEAAATDHALRAERLYHWVQANVEDDTQMFGQAAVMLRARSGNRARVLHYLLGLAGVPSRLALVRSKGSDATVSDLADPDTYAYLVVRVEGSSPIWVSTVERWASFGYLPPALRAQDAILLTPDAPIVRVRDAGEGEDRRTTIMNVHVSTAGAAVFEVVEHFRGAEAAGWREALDSTAPAELERRFEESYVSALVPGAQLRTLQITGREATAASLVLQYTFEVGQLGRAVAQGWALPAIVPSRLAARYATVAARTTTEILTPPMDSDVTVHLHVPHQAQAPQFQTSQHLQGPGGTQFVLRSEWQDDVLTIHRKVRVPMVRIPPPAYARLAEFCHRTDVLENAEVLVRLH